MCICNNKTMSSGRFPTLLGVRAPRGRPTGAGARQKPGNFGFQFENAAFGPLIVPHFSTRKRNVTNAFAGEVVLVSISVLKFGRLRFGFVLRFGSDVAVLLLLNIYIMHSGLD